MALIDETYFDFPVRLDTSNENNVVYLNTIIAWVESKYLPLITYESGDLETIEEMIGNFTFGYYNAEQLRINTDIGNVKLEIDGSFMVYDLSYAFEKFNDGVDTFNLFVTDSDNCMNYSNDMGI